MLNRDTDEALIEEAVIVENERSVTDMEETPNTDDTKIRRIGVVILLITFVVFGAWSALAPIGSAALASGVVAVKSHRKTIQHLDGGIVQEILIKDGDFVEAGALLLVLDNTQSKAQLEIVKGHLVNIRATEARLTAERDGLIAVNYPEALNKLGSEEVITSAIQGQNQIFNARKAAREGEEAVLDKRVQQLISQRKGLQQLRASKQKLVESYQLEIADLRELLLEGYADKHRLVELERSSTQNQGDIAKLKSEIAATDIKVGETRLQKLQLNKKFQEDVVNELSKVQSTRLESEEKRQAIADTVHRAEVIAPVSGIIMRMKQHTEGGVIGGGQPIMDIVPQNEHLIIEAKISPADIDRIKLGMLTEVRFSAFKRASTLKVEGVLITLSADHIVDETTGESFYQADIEITDESKQKLGALQLLPGMPAEVLIQTGDRTFFEYMAQPFSNMFARAFLEE